MPAAGFYPGPSVLVRFADVPREEVLSLLQTTGAERTRRMRGYSDEQLDLSLTVRAARR